MGGVSANEQLGKGEIGQEQKGYSGVNNYLTPCRICKFAHS